MCKAVHLFPFEWTSLQKRMKNGSFDAESHMLKDNYDTQYSKHHQTGWQKLQFEVQLLINSSKKKV